MAIATSDFSFDIGRVASRTFAVIGRNFVSFFVLAIVALLPYILMSALMTQAVLPGVRTGVLSPEYGLLILGGWIVSYGFNFVLQGALTHGTIMDLNGGRASLGDLLMTGLRFLFPLFAIALLMVLVFIVSYVVLVLPGIFLRLLWLIGISFVVYIVPVVMLLVMWSVVVPAKVVENTGIFASFGRSARLTKGHRWAILGLIVIYAVGAAIIYSILLAIFGFTFLAGDLGMTSILSFAASTLVKAAFTVVSSTGVACIYYELRSGKEGVGSEQLASVFE
ncbi:MAG TPA: hypothetical protein VGG48_16780 [Rhizomicrobium sp.]|jgi:hypothetical protein